MIHSDKTWKIYADFLSFYGLLSVRRRPKVQNHIFADNLSTLKCKENYLSHNVQFIDIQFYFEENMSFGFIQTKYILAVWKMKICKGHLNSEWLYEVIVSPKIPTKNYQDFCPGSLLEGRAEVLGIFWLAFWEKQWPHKFILNLTDL